jgi:tetratricopeptide (TPR) repeat protein
MSGEDEDLVLDRLDGAQAASLIVERAGQPGWFSFSHALVEHTLYEELGATRRARLHRRIAEALERQVGGDPGERIGELAHHWGQAVAPVALSKAADYAERAGRRALEQLAPDEAQRWFEEALELRAGQPESDAHRELLVLLGDAQRQAGDAGYRDTLLRAARLAEQAGDVDRQARAVLATWRGYPTVGQRDDELVTALEAAAQALPGKDPRRAAVLSQLAAELTFSALLERRRALADEALTIARRTHDPRLLCEVLLRHTYATWVAHTIDERVVHLKEALALADQVGDPGLQFLAARGARNVLEAGDLDGFDSCLARMAELQQAVPQPLVRWTLRFNEAVRALLAGRLDEAEALAMQALEASGASADAVKIFGAQLITIRDAQGRLHELVDLIAQAVTDNPALPAFRSTHALALCSAGSHEQARELLDTAAADGFASIPLDTGWALTLNVWSVVAFQLDAREVAVPLYDLLLPHAHTITWNGATTNGSVARYLGGLALMLERYDEAEAQLAAASAEHARLGAPLWQAETDRLLGLTLLRRPGGDVQRGRTLLSQAAEAARRHGAAGIERDAEAALAEHATP